MATLQPKAGDTSVEASPAPETRAEAEARPDAAVDSMSVDFLIAILAAVARMALRSSRRQADLQTAMRADQISTTPPQTLKAVRTLERMGYVRSLLQLEDGGILLTVTPDGFDRLRVTSYRDVVEGSRS